jgi:plastocyanin
MKTSYTRIRLLAVFASLAATPVWADGELDTSFGINGVVKIAFPNSSLGYLRDAAVVGGAIEAVGFEYDSSTETAQCTKPFPNLLVVRLSLAGSLMGSPSSYPQNAIQCPTSLIVDPATGDIYVSNTFFVASELETAVAQFDVTGRLVATYAAGGGNGRTFCNAVRVLLDNQGRFVAACGHTDEFGFVIGALLRLNAQNDQLAGQWSGSFPGRIGRTVITQDTSTGAYYVSGAACTTAGNCGRTSAINVVRLNADSGSPDTNYGSGGVITALSADGQVNGITLDGSGNALIGGVYADMNSGFVVRLDSAGTPDATFGSSGVAQIVGDAIVDLRTDRSGQVYALGASAKLLRLNANGTRDTSFSSSSDVQALNGPGSRWQSMQFVDSSNSSVYLLGGAAGCANGCSNAATTAVIAKVMWVSNIRGPSMTTTVLKPSATTITSGQSVTFTATVTGTSPTGTVTFKDGSAVLGDQVKLSSGSASFNTAALTVGSHSIVATYSGDVNNAASISAAVKETVTATSGSPGNGGMSESGGGGGSFTWIDLCGALLGALWRSARTSNYSARRGLTRDVGRSSGVRHA